MRRTSPKPAKPFLFALIALVAAVAFSLSGTSPSPDARRPSSDSATATPGTNQTGEAAQTTPGRPAEVGPAGALTVSALPGKSRRKAKRAGNTSAGRGSKTRSETARGETARDETARAEMGRGAVGPNPPRREREREARPDRPDEAARWRMMQLVDENGEIPHGALVNAWEQARQIPVNPIAWPNAAQEPPPDSDAPAVEPVAGINPAGWTWLGPGNIGGRIRSIIIHPTNPQTMWVGSVSGGIWKTTDGGASWAPLDDFMANLAVGSMAIDPANPNVLYAGTGEGFNAGSSEAFMDVPRGAGIWKTTDGGATWSHMPSTTSSSWYYVNRIAISPANSQLLLAATNSGLWRSADGGATWSFRASGGSLDVNFHPTDGSKAIASGSPSAGYSTDGGLSWTAAAGLPFGRVEVAYSRSDPTIVYASVNNNGGEIYRSANGGQSYTLVNTGTGYLGGQGWYDNIIWVDPTNPNVVIVGGIDLWRSTNGGASLTRISQWQSAPASAHADHHAIVESPQFSPTNRVVFFGNDGGIYRATDVYSVSLTSGWTELNNNLGITQFYGGAGNPTSGRIVGGTQDNGTLRFTPGAGASENWTTPFGGDGGWCAADPTDPNYFYGEYVHLNIHRSTNGGALSEYISGQYWNGSAWAWKSPPYVIPDARESRALFIAPFVLDPNNANRLLGGGLDLWRTNDAKTANTLSTGPSWASIKSSAGAPISAVVVARGNSNVIWVGHTNGSVYFTTNGTDAAPSWTRVDANSPGLPNRYVTRLVIDPANASRVYATFGGFTSDNVWRTDNGGTSWTNITNNLPAAPVRTLAVWQQNTNNLYVGTEVGVFASVDGGASWSPSNDGPTNCSVDELFWMNNTLVAATHGRGMFSINIASTGQPPVVSLTSPANGATFTAPASVSLAATASDPDGSVTQVNFYAGNTLVGTDTTSPYAATWSNAAAGSYAVTARATDNSGNTTTSAVANITVTGGGAPANNNFSAAQVLNGAAGSVAGTNVGATHEVGEPGHAGNAGGASVWYNWTPTSSGSVTFRTAGSNFDTLLAVYTGGSVGALTNIVSNDDTGDLTSLVTFTAAAGTTYRVAVDGYNATTGNITLAWNQTVTCTYSISPTSQSFTFAGGAGSVTVTAGAGCNWTAVSNASFINVTSGASGTAGGTVGYSVSVNNGAQRTGTITIAGQTFVVSQAGTPCGYEISPTSRSFTAAAGVGSISINTITGCSWSAVSNSSFITVTGAASGTGDGTTSYTVAANNGPSPRTGTLTVAGHTFTVTQAGTPCSYSMTPTSQNFVAAGGAGSISVGAGAGCAWTAVSNSGFVTVTSGGTGAGNGTVNYSVAANTTLSPRTGILTVAGMTFTVTQAAAGVGGACPTTPISVGQTVNGALSTTDCRFTDGSYYDLHAFGGAAGQQVSVLMTGGFDTFLALLAPDGSVLDSNDDGGGGTDSRIPATSGLLTLPTSGTYTIIANSFAPNVTGTYALTLSGTIPPSTLQFSSAAFSAGEDTTSATVTVTRAGSTAGNATVVYSTVDDPAAVRCDTANGTAYARCDYATTVDTLQFAPGQSQLTFTVPLINDAHVEGPEVVSLRLSAPTGASLGAQGTAVLTILDNDATAGPNPVNTHPFFVRQHYLDFLSREPDAGGFNAWVGVLNGCPNAFNTDPNSPSTQCDRILVSSAFFRSTEFQLKGLYTYLFYKISFGRLPEYVEITPDMRSVTGQTQAEVFAKRAAFADAWTQRAAFRAAYDPMSNGAYVDALLNPYGLSQINTPDPANPEGTTQVVLTRADLTNRLNAGTLTRPQVLRAIVQSREVDAREFNGAFVAMQYYGYLRRTPEQPGYQNWLNLINANPTDSRTMINGFLNSVEYRLRFGTP